MRECPTCKMSNLSSATACAYCHAELPAEAAPEGFAMPMVEAFVPAAEPVPEPVAVVAAPEPEVAPPRPPKPPKRVEAKVGKPEPMPPYPIAEAPEARPQPTGPSTLFGDITAAFTAFLRGGLAYVCWLMWGTALMFVNSSGEEFSVIFGLVTLVVYGFTAYRFFNPPPKLRRLREIVWFSVGFFPAGLLMLFADGQSPDEAMVASANHWILIIAAATLTAAYKVRSKSPAGSR